MTIRTDLQSVLETRISDGSEAYAIVEEAFADIIAIIRKRYPDLTFAAAELMLADAKRDAEDLLFGQLRGTVDAGEVIDVVVQRFLGGED